MTNNVISVSQPINDNVKRFRKNIIDDTGTVILPNRNYGNKLINVYPTLRCAPYAGNGDVLYSIFNAGTDTASISIDNDKIDPVLGRPMAKVTIPTSSINYASIDFLDLTPFQMDDDDVWMFSFYVPDRLAGKVSAMVYVSDQASFSSNHRGASFGSAMIQKGFNLISVKHTEVNIGASTYGTTGTTRYASWTNYGNNTKDSSSRSIRVHVKVTAAQGSPTDIYVGPVFTAPKGWAKGVVMWSADDVPSSFYDLAIPIIESHGWRCALLNVARYATDYNSTYMNIENIRSAHAKGHEIWGHLWAHENMSTELTAGKTRALKNAAQMWRSLGIPSAGKFMGWPFGLHNDEAVTIAKSLGYKLALSTDGMEINPLIAGCNPFYINRAHLELQNPWQSDAVLNGAIVRGSGVITYMHNAVAGGEGVDSWPATGQFYIDHLKRWCDLVAEHESAGNCVVTTPLEYFRMCGIDPNTDTLAE